MRIFFLILVTAIFRTEIRAQTPEVIAISPTFNEIASTSTPEIFASFNVVMDSSSFDSLSFSVYGERSGYHPGEINYFEENKTASFIAYSKFNSGERVTVTLSNKIKSTQGDSLKGFIWTFRIPSKQVGVNFTEAKEYPGGGNGMQCIDMNNDDSPDIVTSSGIILINDGNGNFPTYWTINGIDYSFPICVNDFNRDGIMDAFYYGANGLTIGLGDGKGNFQERSFNWYWYYFTAADFNGDGFPDIAGINSTPGDPNNPITDWGIAFNDGKGNFEDTVSIKVSGGGVGNCILSADLDNDGDVDIVIGTITYCCGPNLTTYGLDGIIICKNNGLGIFNQFDLYPHNELYEMSTPVYLYSSDYNNDNYKDLVVMGDFGGNVLLNLSNGNFNTDSSNVRKFWHGESLASIAGGDLNGDGWIDLAISGYQFPPEMPLTYYTTRTNCDSYFYVDCSNSYGGGLPNSDIYSSNFADLDNDEDLDLVHCGSGVYITFNQDTLTSVNHDFTQPKEFYLYQNYPNPFNSQTQITIELAKSEIVRISIYNILGEEVKLLKNAFLISGKHRVVWDGKDKNGEELSSGVYFIRAASSNPAVAGQLIKTMLLK